MLDNLCIRARNAGIELSYTDEAAKALAERGFDKAYGARPLRRLIMSEVENLLATYNKSIRQILLQFNL